MSPSVVCGLLYFAGSLASELMILMKAQTYHFTPNFWCVLEAFRYFNEKWGWNLAWMTFIFIKCDT